MTEMSSRSCEVPGPPSRPYEPLRRRETREDEDATVGSETSVGRRRSLRRRLRRVQATSAHVSSELSNQQEGASA